MTYRCSGPPPFRPVVGERIVLVEEGFPAHYTLDTNKDARAEQATLTITEVSSKTVRWRDYSPDARAKFIVARNPRGRGLYISAYLPQTQIVWLDRLPNGGMKSTYAYNETVVIDWDSEVSPPAPLNIKETDKLFTTRTQETKAGYVGQVTFEGAIVWESEPFPKGEFDSDNDIYPGLKQASEAAVEAKKMAVTNLFTNVNV